MTAVTISPEDLEPFATIDEAKAEAMIEDALGMATLVAPCIIGAEFAYPAAAKAVIRGAILRWNETGQGAISAQTAGVYSQTIDTRQTRRAMFYPSEIEQLQKMCRDGDARGAFGIDTAPDRGTLHADICALNFGAEYCSCGADLTGYWPLWESSY